MIDADPYIQPPEPQHQRGIVKHPLIGELEGDEAGIGAGGFERQSE
jgi:hypothetical protein